MQMCRSIIFNQHMTGHCKHCEHKERTIPHTTTQTHTHAHTHTRALTHALALNNMEGDSENHTSCTNVCQITHNPECMTFTQHYKYTRHLDTRRRMRTNLGTNKRISKNANADAEQQHQRPSKGRNTSAHITISMFSDTDKTSR